MTTGAGPTELVRAIDDALRTFTREGLSRRDASELVAHTLAVNLGALIGQFATSEHDTRRRADAAARLTETAARISYNKQVRAAVAAVTAPPVPRRLR